MRTNSLWPAAFVFFGSLTVYSATVYLAQVNHPPALSYFNYLADSFLHSRLDLLNPSQTYDLTNHAGRWYVPFPPLPALMLLPWVAWAGPANTNQLYFSILVGSLNVSLMFLFLEGLAIRGWTQLKTRDNMWLTLLFGFGTAHWSLTIMGQVWFVSQICTLTFILLAAWLAVATGSAWLSGTMLGLAVLGRPPVAANWLLLVGIAAQLFQAREGALPWRKLIRWGIMAAIAVIIALGGLLVYNLLRFGSLFDFGYSQENVSAALTGTLRRHGQFNLYYLPANLKVIFLNLPDFDLANWRIFPDPQGMSLLVTTPALLYLARLRKVSGPLLWGGLAALAALLVPLLCYYNTGWVQFGYRFSLDFMVPMMGLLAIAVDQGKTKDSKVSWLLAGLIILSVVINGWGAGWFIANEYW